MLMMLPFEAPTVFEGIHKSYFRMPRVVKDQRNKFENDDLFRQLSHESAVKYTGFKDRPVEERQMKFIANCQEGHTEVSVVQSGNQFTLMFNPTANPAYNNEGCDFDKELGKVHIKSGFILNGVCVLWRGWIDLQRLEGFGCLEFDEYRAYLEDAMLKQQIDKQQTCNSAASQQQQQQLQQQQSPLGRLNHHSLAGAHLAAAAAAANSLPPGVGLNPSCLGPPPPPHGSLHPNMAGPPPPGSLADSAAHYGNAAIAAAAAAAFHQALSVGAPGAGPMSGLPPQAGLHGLAGVPSSVSAAVAAAAAANGPPSLQLAAQHLPYTNGGGGPVPQQNGVATNQGGGMIPTPTRVSPTLAGQQQQQQQNNGRSGTRSPPERDQQQQQQHHNHQQRQQNHRQGIKRSHDVEQTHIDDVDVVSDIHAHDLDFPPRRIFKTSPISSPAHHHHHHHRATRRA